MNTPRENEPLNRLAAIVGRPNVGKSALFNRLAGRRLAIVHEASGVTRDRLVAECRWGQERFDLVDTGGLGVLDGAASHDLFTAGIQRQIEAAIKDAAVLIFVTDITGGVLPLDEQVARNLHASGRPVVLAANKADNPALDGAALEFTRLGFPVYPVSALHNRGIEPLMQEALRHLPPAVDSNDENALRVAVVGKPNAGKSSYVNRLLRSDRLIVSEIPGTTRDSIEIPFAVGHGSQARRYRLIDTAGMRLKRKARTPVEKFSIMRAEKSIARADVVVHVLDAAVGPGLQDKKIAALIERFRKGAVLLVNKWDLSETTQRQYGRALAEALPFLRHVPVVFVSSQTGYNVRRSIDTIDHVAAQISRSLSTGVLNRILRDAFERTPPPRKGKARLKLFYATQTGARPIRLKLFVNQPRLITPAYRAYLINTLREAFGLEGAPILLHLSARRDSRRIKAPAKR